MTGGANGVLSGLFLGGAGTPPPPPPPPPTIDQPGVQGDWVGNYGVDGYVLAGWNGRPATSSACRPGVTYTLEQGARVRAGRRRPTDVRALESPTRRSAERGPGTTPAQVRVRLNFTAAYSGTLHLYAVDWDWLRPPPRERHRRRRHAAPGRPTSRPTSFNAGAWLHFPITVGRAARS